MAVTASQYVAEPTIGWVRQDALLRAMAEAPISAEVFLMGTDAYRWWLAYDGPNKSDGRFRGIAVLVGSERMNPCSVELHDRDWDGVATGRLVYRW